MAWARRSLRIGRVNCPKLTGLGGVLLDYRPDEVINEGTCVA